MVKRYLLTGLFVVFLGVNSVLYAADTEVILEDNTATSGFSVKKANGETIMRAGGDGNVGIGTTAPGFKLEVGVPGTADEIASMRMRARHLDGVAPSSFSHENLFLNFFSSGVVSLAQGGGNVGIGTTSPDQKLSVNGNASKVGGGSWAVFSDERLKTIHGTFDAGLEEVLKLQPISYRYNKDNPLSIPDEGEHIGFSAQAVQKVIPEAVSENSNGYLMVNNDPILWAMLNAIKVQQAQIEQLNAENKQLKEIFSTLTTRQDALETMFLAVSNLPKEKLVKLDEVKLDGVQKVVQ